MRVGVRIRVWIRIRVGIWRSETGGFGIGLSEWRGVRVEEFGFEFEFGLGVFGIEAFEVGIGERGREEGEEEEEEEDGKERKEVK